MVEVRYFQEPPVCEKELYRYVGFRKHMTPMEYIFAGGKEENTNPSDGIKILIDTCLGEILPKLSYKVCYMELPLKVEEDVCDFGYLKVTSKDLAKNLDGCEKVYVFAATIGIEMDRLITKYTHTWQAKSYIYQAIGTERIEALCDRFCEFLQNDAEEKDGACRVRPRFSPGYGDLPLEVQKDIFQLLNCSKNIGLTLNDSLLMSPSKSVTAFVGVSSDEVKNEENKCAACERTDCQYREI